MNIKVVCEACGKAHEVAAANAGRRGKCTRCGAIMIVPAAPTADQDGGDGSEDGYGLAEAPAPIERPARRPVPAEEASTFRRVADTGASGAERVRSSRDDDFDGDPGHYILKAMPILLGLTALASIVIALAVPNGVSAAGKLLAGLGVLLFGAAYTVGLWAAYREDSLYAMLYLAIPFYTAYYIVSRFDDLRRWVIIGAIGLVLSTIGGAMAIGSPVPEVREAVPAEPRAAA